MKNLLNLTNEEMNMLECGIDSMIQDLEYTINDGMTENYIVVEAEEEQKQYIELREKLF